MVAIGRYSLLVMVLIAGCVACGPIPSGYPGYVHLESTDEPNEDLTRLELLEQTLAHQQAYLEQLVAQQEEQQRVIDLLQSQGDYELILAQIAAIDARLVEALQTIVDLQEQLAEEKSKHKHHKEK